MQYRPVDLQVAQVGLLRVVSAACGLSGFSPDSRWLLTVTGARTCLWETGAFDVKKEFEKVTHFAFSRDSLHLAVYQPSDGQIQVIELETGRVTDCIRPPSGDVFSLHFLPVTAEIMAKIYPRYNPEALDRYDRMKEEETAFYATLPVAGRQQALAQAPPQEDDLSGSRRYSVGKEGRNTRIFDRHTSTAVYRTTEFVQATHLSQDGQYALLITGRHTQVVKLPEGTLLRQIARTRSPNDQIGYSLPHTVWLLVRVDNLLLDGVTGEVVLHLADLGASDWGHVAVSPTGRYVAGMDYLQSTLRIRDLQLGSVLTHSDEWFRRSDKLIFSPDSTTLLVKGDPAFFVPAG